MSGISSDVFDKLSADIIARIAPASLLDIGPGQGKYGKLARSLVPACHTSAVEISATYAQSYGLDTIYDEVIIGDGAGLVADPAWRNRTFDLVVIGDCIEHMPKSQGLDLLNFLTYRCGYLLVIVPEFAWYDTDAAVMEHTESHISVWSEADFSWHDRFAFMRAEIMQVFLLRGYQKAPLALHDLVAAANAEPVSIRSFGGKDYKMSCLQMQAHERVETIDGVNWTYRHG